MPEPEAVPQAPAAAEPRPKDWEDNPSPERTLLKEYAGFVDAALKTMLYPEVPERAFLGYLDEWLRIHASELPAAELEQFTAKREELITKIGQKMATQQ